MNSQPQYIKIVMPSNNNNNYQYLGQSQQSGSQPVQFIVPKQIRIIKPTPSVRNLTQGQSSSNVDSDQCSSVCSLNSQNGTAQEAAPFTASTVVSAMPPVLLSTNNTAESSSIDTTKSSQKRSVSVMENDDHSNKAKCFVTKHTLLFFIDTKTSKRERSKNWSVEETFTFIAVWTDYYDKLMTGGSRNSPIHQAMAQELNELLAPRTVNSYDVKTKIFNLAAEYRRKKKEQGKTGSSPSTWPYFACLDKLLGNKK